MRRPVTVLLVAGVFALALVAAPGVGAQSTTAGNETVVGAEIGDDASNETVESVVSVLETRLDLADVDGHVEVVTANGTQYVAAVTDADRANVTALLRDRGRVEITARFPVEKNESTVYREETLLTNDDFEDVGRAQQPSPVNGITQPHASVTLRERAAENYSQRLQEYGFTDEGIGSCPPDADQNPDDAKGYCLYTVDDGEVLYSASLGPQLAKSMQNGEFVADPSFVMTTSNFSAAERLSVTLRSGAYPVSLSVTDLPAAVESAALSAAANGSATAGGTGDGSTDGTTEDTPDESSGETGETEATTDDESMATDASADETGGTTASTTTETGALGPGFTPLAALVAVVLASGGLLATRLR